MRIRRLAILDADMHMQAKNEVRPRHQLQVLDDLGVAGIGIDLLRPPVGEGMRGTSHQTQAVFFRQANHVAAQVEEVFLRLLDVLADARPYLDDGLMHLRLDALFQLNLPLREHLGRNVRPQIAGLGVDGLVLLFNAQRKRRPHLYFVPSIDSTSFWLSSFAKRSICCSQPP